MSEITCYFFRVDSKFVRIEFKDILYLEAAKNYTSIVTAKKTYKTLVTMRQLEDELPKKLFCRVHRSFIVHLDSISSFNYLFITLGEAVIPFGITYRQQLIGRLPVILHDIRSKNSFTSFRMEELLPHGNGLQEN